MSFKKAFYFVQQLSIIQYYSLRKSAQFLSEKIFFLPVERDVAAAVGQQQQVGSASHDKKRRRTKVTTWLDA